MPDPPFPKAEGPWPLSICLLHNVPLFQAHHGCDCDVGEYPTMYMRVLEVVPESRALAAEREAERLREALGRIRDWDDEHAEFLDDVEVELKAIAREALAENGEQDQR